MAAKLRKREEIPAQYKWDLSHIYPDDAAWEAALADVLASGKKFAAWEGKVAENPRQAIREYFDLNQQAEPVFSYAFLRGETDKIPEIFSQHRLSDINMLAPGKPMMEMIENQVYLAQGAYAKVVGRSAELLAVCEAMHYALVALHIRIQTAAAYESWARPRRPVYGCGKRLPTRNRTAL